MGSLEGASKAKKRQIAEDKKLKESAWKSRNAKALEVAASHGIDGKHLIERAGDSLVSACLTKSLGSFFHFSTCFIISSSN